MSAGLLSRGASAISVAAHGAGAPQCPSRDHRQSDPSDLPGTSDDARGMAIKLLGVTGQRLLTGEESTAATHDLILTNHHSFFLTNLADYVSFMQTVADKGNPTPIACSLNRGKPALVATACVQTPFLRHVPFVRPRISWTFSWPALRT